jgi:hypothetical protein
MKLENRGDQCVTAPVPGIPVLENQSNKTILHTLSLRYIFTSNKRNLYFIFYQIRKTFSCDMQHHTM